MKQPLEYLNEISEKYCFDYPGIKTCNATQRLWAIESTLEGTKQANMECHQMIQILRKRLNLSNDDLLKLWETEIINKK